MKILITGASGFVGSFLALKFSKQKKKILLISKKKRFAINNNLIKQVDINDFKKLENFFKKEKIQFIIHCAALNESQTAKNRKLAYTTALVGTENLLKLSSKYKIKKFFFFSVLQVYGKEISGQVKSTNQIQLDNDYAKSHYLAEKIIERYSIEQKINVNILRLAYSFSKPINNQINRSDLIPINFCLDAINNKEIILKSDGNSRRDFIYLNDVFLKISKIMRSKLDNQIYYNFSSGKTFKIIEVAIIVQKLATKLLSSKIKIKINKKNRTIENKFKVPSDIYSFKIKKKQIKLKLINEITKIIKNYAGIDNRC
jgi:UDP-glucose 4-epimerase